jgi:hypothetical protein
LLIFNSFLALFFFRNNRIFNIYIFLKIFLTKWRILGIFGPKYYIYIWQFIFKNREFVIDFI